MVFWRPFSIFFVSKIYNLKDLFISVFSRNKIVPFFPIMHFVPFFPVPFCPCAFFPVPFFPVPFSGAILSGYQSYTLPRVLTYTHSIMLNIILLHDTDILLKYIQTLTTCTRHINVIHPQIVFFRVKLKLCQSQNAVIEKELLRLSAQISSRRFK